MSPRTPDEAKPAAIQGELFVAEEVTPDVYPAAFLTQKANAPFLTKVEIDGLKGFDHTTVELRQLTVLTGPNNSGKSTVLQAIALAFECFRRCLDAQRWTLTSSGRAVVEFEFLPVNQPKDLWFEQKWKPSARAERNVRVGLTFSNGFNCVFKIRFLFGLLNISLETAHPEPTPELLKSIAAATPILLPATPGPGSHEQYTTLGQIHRLLAIREPSRIIRNVLCRLQKESGNEEAVKFVSGVMKKYFNASLRDIQFEEARDLEIRAPYSEGSYELDIISAGSGLNQILQLAAIIAWRQSGIILLDEPDSHLHTSLQTQLLNFLMSLVDQYKLQVILATHSRDLISQTPLQSIIPIDRTRKELKPLESVEHLLLEYQRQGTVTNIDLALLYQTKRCAFVEGPTDSRLLRTMAERLNIPLFAGKDQVVLFEFEGCEKLKLLPELTKLFEKVIGANLRWGAKGQEGSREKAPSGPACRVP